MMFREAFCYLTATTRILANVPDGPFVSYTVASLYLSFSQCLDPSNFATAVQVTYLTS